MKRRALTCEDIALCLPDPPSWGEYRVEQFSKLVFRVWLVDHRPYTHTTEEVKTIWGFVKSTGDVMRPTNSKKISTDRVCRITEIPQSMNLTTITPKYTTLLTQFL